VCHGQVRLLLRVAESRAVENAVCTCVHVCVRDARPVSPAQGLGALEAFTTTKTCAVALLTAALDDFLNVPPRAQVRLRGDAGLAHRFGLLHKGDGGWGFSAGSDRGVAMKPP